MARKRYRSEVRSSSRRNDEADDSKRAKRLQELRWFREKAPHELVFSLDQRIGLMSSARRSQDLYHACLYDDAELGSLFQGITSQGEFTPQTMTSNIVKRQIDTYVERQEKNQPVPMALPIDATYEQAERSKDLTKLFKGILDEIDYFEMLTTRRRDRAIFGDGIAYNFRVGRKLQHMRTFPWELRTDPREALRGKPKTLIFRRWEDRLEFADRYPEHAKEIMADEFSPDDDLFAEGRDDSTDQVWVLSIWHLPNGEPTEKDAKDGCFVECISTKTLANREYRRNYFPFSKTSFSNPVAGFRGEGMAAQLAGLQFEVNAVGLRMQEQSWMTGTYVWTQPGDGLEIDPIDNGTLTHIRSEQRPEFFQPAPWHPSFFEYLMWLRGRAAAEETRQSEMASRGELPSGLESGKAIRSWNQLDDQAYLSHGKKDERDAINTCWQFFDLCEEIHAEVEAARANDKKVKPLTFKSEKRDQGRSVIDRLEYGEVRMDREAFDLHVYPTSFLSGTPAEKYQSAKELASDGLVSRDAVLSMLDIPDVERVLRLETAPRRAVEKILSKLLRSKNPRKAYVYPEPAFNLELCRALALMYYLDGFTDEAPEPNLRMVLQFAIDAEEQLERSNQPDDPNVPPDPNAGMPPDDGGPIDPSALGADPSLFAAPQAGAPMLPQGAATPTNMPTTPAM